MMEHIIVIRMRRRRDGARQRKATQSLHRSLRDMSNPFHDANFRALYRLTPDMALGVVAELKPYYPQSSYANAIPIELKVSIQSTFTL